MAVTTGGREGMPFYKRAEKAGLETTFVRVIAQIVGAAALAGQEVKQSIQTKLGTIAENAKKSFEHTDAQLIQKTELHRTASKMRAEQLAKSTRIASLSILAPLESMLGGIYSAVHGVPARHMERRAAHIRADASFAGIEAVRLEGIRKRMEREFLKVGQEKVHALYAEHGWMANAGETGERAYGKLAQDKMSEFIRQTAAEMAPIVEAAERAQQRARALTAQAAELEQKAFGIRKVIAGRYTSIRNALESARTAP